MQQLTPLPKSARSAACAAALLALLCFSLPAPAATDPAPKEVVQAISEARLAGQTRLVVFGFNIYDAKLWTDTAFSAANYGTESFALELRYLRNFSGESIAERSLKEMRKLGVVNDDLAAQWLQIMKKTFPDIKKGDRLIGVHRPDGSASFVLNGKLIGQWKDPEFSRLFFGIWLSPKTSEPKMREALIGSAAGAPR
jgi:hypothetical protein